jgi:hypothetical protein
MVILKEHKKVYKGFKNLEELKNVIDTVDKLHIIMKIHQQRFRSKVLDKLS